jgi:disulfide oxidoreductase YuzD
MFGDAVQIAYYEMADPVPNEQAQELLKQVPEGYLYYPLVYVNDKLQIVGSAQYYEIYYAVREVLGAPVAE